MSLLSDAAMEFVMARRAVIDARKARLEVLEEIAPGKEDHACWREVGHEGEWCTACERARPFFERYHDARRRRESAVRKLERAAVPFIDGSEERLVELHLSPAAEAVVHALVPLGIYGRDREDVCERLVMRGLQERLEERARAASKAGEPCAA